MADTQKKDKLSEGIKAEINKQRKEQGQKGIGEYDEAPGGGTPGAKGGRGSMGGNFVVADSPEDPIAIEAKEKGQKVRYNQPRNEDGQFTYNSANAKGLSTKTSRGHTKPPFLTGVDLTFIKKGSTFQYDENGNTKKIISSIDMTAEELVNSCKVYFKHEGGFLGVIGTAVTKKGSPSKVEKTGELGKTGQVDLSEKAQSTQQAINAASQKKDVTGLEAQKKASEEASAANLKAKYNKGVEKIYAKKKQQTVPSSSTVGAGTGTGTTSKPVAPVQPKPQTPQQPQKPLNTAKIFTKKNTNQQPDLNADFGENIKQEIKANPQEWVNKNKSVISKVMKKHPETTVKAIVNAVYSGKVKNWNQLLK